ncbi:hypothetical protein PZH30_23710, partial [Escherichia coli]|nr:hypothetical protein [Escherichia coli]
ANMISFCADAIGIRDDMYLGAGNAYIDDIIIDPFKRRPPEDAIAVSETTSLPTLPLDLREFQMQQEKELLQLSLQQGKYNQKRAELMIS